MKKTYSVNVSLYNDNTLLELHRTTNRSWYVLRPLFNNRSPYFTFFFNDDNDAMIFKLTWGGI